MRKAVDYLRAHPIIAVAVAVGIVGVVFLLWPQPGPVTSPPPAPQPEAAPPPAAVAPPMPGPEAAPAPAPAATPTPRPRPGAVDAGRPDPFQPLVVQAGPGQPGVPVPPPAPLPPPLFPGQPGQPGATEEPAPPPKEASRAQVIGLMGDNGGVAVIRLEGQTYVVSRGDVILDRIRVSRIDALRGIVVLEQEGEQFELILGGVNGPHVAATASSGII
jgi:hypothetical protein